MVVALVLGARGLSDLLVFGLASFALAAIVRQFYVGARARRTAYGKGPKGEGWVRATTNTVRSNPRLYGGLIVHVGVILIAIALAASGSYSTKEEVRLAKGESVTVDGYRLTYLGNTVTASDQKRVVKARVRIERGDDDLGVYAPAVNIFPNSTSAIGTPSVRTGLLRDVYLTLISSPVDGGRVTLGVAVNPMVVWLWIGGGFLAVGTVIALLPVLRRRRPAASVETPEVVEPDPVPA
jgi:cytochrome c-type biogenesis protein CcmF